jgi:fucokinase
MEPSIMVLNSKYKPEKTKAYDICVITAANEFQAQGYREQIRIRAEDNRLPEETEFIVIADPDGKRIGSGGSTIYVLYKLVKQLSYSGTDKENNSVHDLLAKKRILILHSGGDSRRLPAYSPTGKAFFPLPIDYFSLNPKAKQTIGFVTLFDVLLQNLMQLPYLEDGQLVIASGDVLLSFDPSEAKFFHKGVTGVAYPGPVSIASKHGVYIPDQLKSNQSLRKVINFLQKPDYKQLLENDALDASERAYVDTGIINFSLDALEKLIKVSGIFIDKGETLSEDGSLCEQIIKGHASLDIYKELPYAMLDHGTIISGFQNSKCWADALNDLSFYVCLLSYCGFFHIGTSRQLLQNFHTINHTASMYGFQNFSKSKIKNESELNNAFIYNSLADTSSIKSRNLSFIEGCHINGNVELSGENIITGIPKNAGDIKLKKGLCITCIPVLKKNQDTGWVTVMYGVDDDFKQLANDNSTTFLNKPFEIWMEENNINPDDLWDNGEPHELWKAKLFPFSMNASESVGISLNVNSDNTDSISKQRIELRDHFEVWKQADRMSMEEILGSVDYRRLLDNYTELFQKINLGRLTEILIPQSELSSKEILSWCKEPRDYRNAEERVLSIISQTNDILFQARLYKLLSNIVHQSSLLKIYEDRKSGIIGNPKSERVAYYEEIAHDLVLKAIKKGLKNENSEKIGNPGSYANNSPLTKGVRGLSFHEKSNLMIKIRSDEVVWVCAPSRLDFAGGWSDTPPYCLEHGGSVLNASVKLNGQYPIQVIGKLYKDLCIRVNSIDLGENIIISSTNKMLSYKDPSEWASLPKAAFITTGIIPENTDLSLQEILEKLGGGIDLTLFSAVPSGSGLGTSSILGSAIIACLSRILGQELTPEELFNRTLYMEQLMTTGGGWQDQIGGVVGGVKHIQTEPNLFQIPRISWTDLKEKSDMNLSERFLLYYTGYRRMARNILRNIVGKYLDRDELTIKTIGQLREKSYEMKSALDHRDINAFGKMIAEVWELNKTLDPGTSNNDLESIIGKISHLIYGAKLLGAGGGGFLFIVTKGAEQSSEIKRILEKEPPNNRARFFDFDIDPVGLKISVL